MSVRGNTGQSVILRDTVNGGYTNGTLQIDFANAIIECLSLDPRFNETPTNGKNTLSKLTAEQDKT